MDGGKSTLVEDPSVISCNPANLAEIKEPSVMIAINAIAGKANYDHPILTGLSTKNSLALLPDMFAALPVGEGRYVLGLGINTPFGQSAEWEDNFTFPYFSRLGVVNVNPTFATKLAKNVSVGVGADLYMSTIEQKALAPGLGEIKLSGSGSGLGANAAVTWRPTDRQQVALTCRSGFDIEYDGDTEINSPWTTLPFPLVAKSDFDARMKFPTILTLGYGISLSEKLKIGADVEWVQASRNDAMPVDLGRNQPLIAPQTEVVNDWEDNWGWGVGCSYELSEKVALRGSYKFMQTPIPDATYAPAYPDNDRHILALGIGLKQGAHSLDLAYALNFIADRDVANSQNAPAGTYDYASQIAGVSYIFAF